MQAGPAVTIGTQAVCQDVCVATIGLSSRCCVSLPERLDRPVYDHDDFEIGLHQAVVGGDGRRAEEALAPRPSSARSTSWSTTPASNASPGSTRPASPTSPTRWTSPPAPSAVRRASSSSSGATRRTSPTSRVRPARSVPRARSRAPNRAGQSTSSPTKRPCKPEPRGRRRRRAARNCAAARRSNTRSRITAADRGRGLATEASPRTTSTPAELRRSTISSSSIVGSDNAWRPRKKPPDNVKLN